MRDSTRNPDRALGEATEILTGVHRRVASFRWPWVDVPRKVVVHVSSVKGPGAGAASERGGEGPRRSIERRHDPRGGGACSMGRRTLPGRRPASPP
ncbi:hypothetical protein B005_2191 [Nocardiopsis alba ATCC BAA-2165]|uniref:Uncharacterized protein n=1 Tax=Nocardiopsis alba (strain ATCC BAA-2165 / BE74) TaxID=1205910 RepID=J7LJL0_NOCAA|nr:hypothetical protein B005_2191 [Nocardiopsis alba ATCC BAA-2165]